MPLLRQGSGRASRSHSQKLTILCLEATQSFNFSPLAPADEGVERGPDERCFGVVVNAIFDLVTQGLDAIFSEIFQCGFFSLTFL